MSVCHIPSRWGCCGEGYLDADQEAYTALGKFLVCVLQVLQNLDAELLNLNLTSASESLS